MSLAGAVPSIEYKIDVQHAEDDEHKHHEVVEMRIDIMPPTKEVPAAKKVQDAVGTQRQKPV